MSTKRTIVDEIKKAIDHANANPPRKSWFSRLPPEGQQEMLEVKRRYAAGEYSRVPYEVLYRGVVARCKGAKWEIPKSSCTLINWLRKA